MTSGAKNESKHIFCAWTPAFWCSTMAAATNALIEGRISYIEKINAIPCKAVPVLIPENAIKHYGASHKDGHRCGGVAPFKKVKTVYFTFSKGLEPCCCFFSLTMTSIVLLTFFF